MRNVFFCLMISLMLTGSLMGQTNDEGLAFLQFSFLNPGARSLAMGGAFTGLADDATAVQANPAGLSILVRPEFSVEFASSSYKNSIPWYAGTSTYEHVYTPVDASTHFAYRFSPRDFPSTRNSLSFASFVYPVSANRLVLGGFYTQQCNFTRDFRTNGISSFISNRFNSYYYPTDNALSLDMKNIGFSAAVQPGNMVSAGVTVYSSQLDLSSSTRRVTRTSFAPDAPPDWSRTANIESLKVSDRRFSYALGVLFRPAHYFSGGFVYTSRPAFHGTSRYEWPSGQIDQSTGQKFKLPDSFAAGISIRPNDRLTFNIDVDRILYSQMMDGYYNAFYRANGVGIGSAGFQETTLKVDDGTEYRVGAEYVLFLGRRPFSVRGGYWRDPFHSVVQTMPDDRLIELPEYFNDVNAAPFNSQTIAKDTNHFSVGTGIVFGNFALDWGYDYSKRYKRFVISTVFYIGKVAG
jgi:long-chain fatty acid transport protein